MIEEWHFPQDPRQLAIVWAMTGPSTCWRVGGKFWESDKSEMMRKSTTTPSLSALGLSSREIISRSENIKERVFWVFKVLFWKFWIYLILGAQSEEYQQFPDGQYQGVGSHPTVLLYPELQQVWGLQWTETQKYLGNNAVRAEAVRAGDIWGRSGD